MRFTMAKQDGRTFTMQNNKYLKKLHKRAIEFHKNTKDIFSNALLEKELKKNRRLHPH